MQPTTPKPSNPVHNSSYVGPYEIKKELGRGQTGTVRLGVHHKTGKKVAIKIVNKERLTEPVLLKVEREITIMKLIEHPNILRLIDVYENKKNLYLILEHVSGGELFDYLVKQSRLSQKEAKKYFKQIISALDFCHSHLICHRDLKPENLLMDDKLNIKIADFGMASLQVDGSMLETSCGSPHYACPEVIKGQKYDGRKADVWSCGVILYALLVGSLPFDDENLKVLLEKIKKGDFSIPPYVTEECQELLKLMIETDPNKRLTLEEVNKHPWVLHGSKEEIELELPMSQVVQTAIIPSIENIDTDILSNMCSLGSFKDQSKLVENLLNERHNIEKVIYFLLLDRKFKNPSNEDNDEIMIRNKLNDAPRKRIDKCKTTSPGVYSQLTIGSPAIPRRGMPISHGPRHQSCHTTPLQSPCTSPLVSNRDLHFRNYDTGSMHSGSHSYTQTTNNNNHLHNQFKQQPTSLPTQSTAVEQDSISITSNNSINNQIRARINSLKNTAFSTPKFFRRKLISSDKQQSTDSQQSQSLASTPNQNNPQTPQQQHHSSSTATTPTSDSKSWFQRWNFSNNSSKDNNSVNSTTTNIQDKEYVHIINDRPLNSVKADLIHAFLSTTDLIHNINSPSLFRCEYRSPDKFLARNVKFKVEIVTETQSKTLAQIENKQNSQAYKILFSWMHGSTRQFQNICKHICQLISSHNYSSIQQRHQRQLQQNQKQQNQNTTTTTTNIITNSINNVLQQQQQQRPTNTNISSSTNTPTSRRNSNVSSNGIIMNTPSPSSTSSSTSSTTSSSSSSSSSASNNSSNASPMILQQTSPLPIITNIESTSGQPLSPIQLNNLNFNTNSINNNVNRTRKNSNTSLNSPNLNSNNYLFHNQYQQFQQQQQQQQLNAFPNQQQATTSHPTTTVSNSQTISSNTNPKSFVTTKAQASANIAAAAISAMSIKAALFTNLTNNNSLVSTTNSTPSTTTASIITSPTSTNTRNSSSNTSIFSSSSILDLFR